MQSQGRWQSISKLVPREYQLDALKKALSLKRCVIVLPTGAGKTLIGVLFAEELYKQGLRILVLEPTKILVEQTFNYYIQYSDIPERDISMYHSLKRDLGALKRRVVITTPEAALARELFDFDALVVDECHHAVGDDPLGKFLERSTARYRLGLSAHIPLRHRKTISSLIGRILQWDWNDPRLRKYVAEWVAEVYESDFREDEQEVYREIDARMTLEEGRNKALYRLALIFLSRDGPLALKETIGKKTKLSSLLSDLKEKILSLRDLHKFGELQRILESHDFEKALIFIDRVIVAKTVAKKIGATLLTGRKSVREKKQELEAARKAKIIVSTSAGEEGVDLPTVDLLIIWSNTASALRFVQRRGRALRKAGRLPKTIVFIVTPDTIDMDLFVEGLFAAKQAGVDIGILEGMLKKYAKMGVRAKILSLLDEPMPADWIAKILGVPEQTVRRHLRVLCEEGEVVVVYTEVGKSYIKKEALPLLSELRPQLFTGGGSLKPKTRERKRSPPFYLERVVVREKIGDIERIYTLRVGCLVPDQETWELLRKHYSSPEVYRNWG